jgi:hypothetical protein
MVMEETNQERNGKGQEEKVEAHTITIKHDQGATTTLKVWATSPDLALASAIRFWDRSYGRWQ